MKALLTLTCAGQFMVLLDNTIVGAALPDMQQRLHTGLTGLQWIVDAYVLLVAMLLLSGGVFADRFGRKRVFLAGVVVFTAASVLCCARALDRLADRRQGAAGHRGRGAEPRLAGPARRRVSRAAENASRRSGCGPDSAESAWPPDRGRRHPGGCLRLARHLPGQCAHRRGPAAGRSARAGGVPQSERAADRRPRDGPVRPGRGRADLRADRGRFPRLDLAGDPGQLRRRGWCSSPPSSRSKLVCRRRCCRCGCSGSGCSRCPTRRWSWWGSR